MSRQGWPGFRTGEAMSEGGDFAGEDMGLIGTNETQLRDAED